MIPYDVDVLHETLFSCWLSGFWFFFLHCLRGYLFICFRLTHHCIGYVHHFPLFWVGDGVCWLRNLRVCSRRRNQNEQLCGVDLWVYGSASKVSEDMTHIVIG